MKDKSKPIEPPRLKKPFINYVLDMALVVTFTTTFITGIIKFPEFLNTIGVSQADMPMYELSLLHDWGAIFMGIIILAHIILHLKWLKNMTIKYAREADRRKAAKAVVAIFIVIILIFVIIQAPAIQQFLFGPSRVIMIDGIGEFEYDPKKIETVRSDIFKPAHFSVFDILVYLDNRSEIELDYHFDAAMDTYVIDSINGKSNWWYMAYYDGGWPETNTFRMDLFPYKRDMYIRIIREDSSKLDTMYQTFRDEVTQQVLNGGKVIIPEVTITGTKNEWVFLEVEVTAHDLRDDFFQNGVITAIDVIMTLGDQNKIDYELQFYKTIGFAEVKNYYVDRINEDETYGRCGFVYEAGAERYSGARGNHIHIPADIRVITSPEYELWFWICI
jgi:hypothetical protein